MHIISTTKLKEFFAVHPEAESKLNDWFRTLEHNSATSLKDLKQTFATADYVPEKFTVFDVGGNAYGVVTVIHYNRQRAYIRSVFTNAEYDKWTNKLADAVGDDETHPLYSLFDLTMTLIGQWEHENLAIPTAPPREVLRYLLEEHYLKQKDSM